MNAFKLFQNYMPEPYTSVFKELIDKKVNIPATKTKTVDNLHELNEFLNENKFPIFENKGKNKYLSTFLLSPALSPLPFSIPPLLPHLFL